MSVTLDNLIGAKVALKTTAGDFEGEVFCYDGPSSMVTIAEPSGGFRIIKSSGVKTVKVLSKAPAGGFSSAAPLSALSVDAVSQAVTAAVAKAANDAGNIGDGVTVEAQAVFDALNKTLPCSWQQGKTIGVLGGVAIVSPPYTVASVSGSDNVAVDRVKKVLEGERAKGLGL